MIDVKKLHKSFGSLKVLQGIDLHVNKGDVVSIIGPSGSGKSTLLRSINLLETATAGEIWVDGKLKATLNSQSNSAWGNPVTELIVLGKGVHTVEIRMAEDSLTKTFNLLDMGYSK